MCDALVKAFSSAHCTFDIPDGGMFLWLTFKNKNDVSGNGYWVDVVMTYINLTGAL